MPQDQGPRRYPTPLPGDLLGAVHQLESKLIESVGNFGKEIEGHFNSVRQQLQTMGMTMGTEIENLKKRVTALEERQAHETPAKIAADIHTAIQEMIEPTEEKK